jgi:hypothetical protein
LILVVAGVKPRYSLATRQIPTLRANFPRIICSSENQLSIEAINPLLRA